MSEWEWFPPRWPQCQYYCWLLIEYTVEVGHSSRCLSRDSCGEAPNLNSPFQQPLVSEVWWFGAGRLPLDLTKLKLSGCSFLALAASNTYQGPKIYKACFRDSQGAFFRLDLAPPFFKVDVCLSEGVWACWGFSSCFPRTSARKAQDQSKSNRVDQTEWEDGTRVN